MAKRGGTYKSDKRRKEVSRQKKQEEKRQRRFSSAQGTKEADVDEPLILEENPQEENLQEEK